MSPANKRQNASDQTETSEIYVRFIDILFAVVIGQSFVLLSSKDWFSSWLAQPLQNAFGIATILLVYGLVITSWVGYHQSTRAYPIRSPVRFVIDVVLLFVYYMGFVNANNFELVIWIFFFAFLSYTAWDIVRLCEYWRNKKAIKPLWRRLAVTIVFAFSFLAVAELNAMLQYVIPGIQWGFFVVVFILLVWFRILKRYKKPGH